MWEMRAKDDDEFKIDVGVDSKWANGAERKSTSGGMMVTSETAVKHWSRTHAARALCVAGSECQAIVAGTAERLGRQVLLSDLGPKAGIITRRCALRTFIDTSNVGEQRWRLPLVDAD